jgi:rhodanese-related sulfurtransferase
MMQVLTRLSFNGFFFAMVLFQCQPNPHAGKVISPEEVYHIIYDSVRGTEYVVLDIRGRMDYVRGHLVSALWLSPDSITQKLPAMMNEKRPFIIYGSDDTQISEVTTRLSENGVAKFYVMRGGFSKWTELGYPAAIQLVRNTSEKIRVRRKDISIKAAHLLLDNLISKVVLVDIRSYPAFAEEHIEGAMSIPYVPLNDFVVGIEEQNFARNRPIIIYCDTLSDIGEKAAEVMLRNDFTQVYLLKCDIAEWDSTLRGQSLSVEGLI